MSDPVDRKAWYIISCSEEKLMICIQQTKMMRRERWAILLRRMVRLVIIDAKVFGMPVTFDGLSLEGQLFLLCMQLIGVNVIF